MVNLSIFLIKAVLENGKSTNQKALELKKLFEQELTIAEDEYFQEGFDCALEGLTKEAVTYNKERGLIIDTEKIRDAQIVESKPSPYING